MITDIAHWNRYGTMALYPLFMASRTPMYADIATILFLSLVQHFQWEIFSSNLLTFVILTQGIWLVYPCVMMTSFEPNPALSQGWTLDSTSLLKVFKPNKLTSLLHSLIRWSFTPSLNHNLWPSRHRFPGLSSNGQTGGNETQLQNHFPHSDHFPYFLLFLCFRET